MTREWTPKGPDGIALQRSEVPDYIRDIAAELARLARQHKLPELACFLETAAMVADDHSDDEGPATASTRTSASRLGSRRRS
jgi:citrate lyase beta subunit